LNDRPSKPAFVSAPLWKISTTPVVKMRASRSIAPGTARFWAGR
jgi:hypothetical protein